MVRPGRQMRAASSGIFAGAHASVTAMNVADVLRRISVALEQAGIPYMLTGSLASAYYGAPRSTQDIDVVIAATPVQLRTLVQLLPRDEYYVDLDAALEAHQRQSLFNVVDLLTGWKIDFIICKARAFSEEEFRRRSRIHLQGLSLFVASPEDVVLSKLEWAKQAQSSRQIEDVAGILRLHGKSLDRAYLEKWIHELVLATEWNDACRAAGVSE
jgi:hypothetical protein